MLTDRLRIRLNDGYQWANRRSGGVLEILKRAFTRFNELRGYEAAASVAYYALFSLFPLLLLLTSITGYVLVNVESPGEVLEFLTNLFPVADSFLRDNLLPILEQRGTSGVVGLVALLWSASGVFVTLTLSINRAWPDASTRNSLHGRLISVAMIGILVVLLILSLLLNIALSLLPLIELPLGAAFLTLESPLWQVLSALVPVAIVFLVFLGMFRWIPNTRVAWVEAFWGAVFSALGWLVATAAFRWFLDSGMANYDVVYGSLGAIIALLTWIYLSAYITILGAHLSASVATARVQRKLAQQGSQAGAPLSGA